MRAKDRQFEVISVVVPVYNEEAVLPELYRRLTRALRQYHPYEIIFVNDGSTDGSLKVLQRLCRRDDHCKVIDLSRNFGQQFAITAGLDHAAGDAVIVMDSDLQDPPEVIPELVAKWKEGYEVVYAQRKNRKGDSAFKVVTARWFYRLLSKWAPVDIPLDVGDFRLLDRQVVDQLKGMREKSRYLRGMVSWIGFRQIGVLYDRDARFAGTRKYTLAKSLRLAWDGFCSFSTVPLSLFGYLGLGVVLSALVSAGVLLAKALQGHPVSGMTVLLVAILFLGGVQLLSVGVVGQYLARIFNESRDRPLYIVRNRYGFDRDEHAALPDWLRGEASRSAAVEEESPQLSAAPPA